MRQQIVICAGSLTVALPCAKDWGKVQGPESGCVRLAGLAPLASRPGLADGAKHNRNASPRRAGCCAKGAPGACNDLLAKGARASHLWATAVGRYALMTNVFPASDIL